MTFLIGFVNDLSFALGSLLSIGGGFAIPGLS